MPPSLSPPPTTSMYSPFSVSLVAKEVVLGAWLNVGETEDEGTEWAGGGGGGFFDEGALSGF